MQRVVPLDYLTIVLTQDTHFFVMIIVRRAGKKEAETGATRSQADLSTSRVAGSTEQRELRLPDMLVI